MQFYSFEFSFQSSNISSKSRCAEWVSPVEGAVCKSLLLEREQREKSVGNLSCSVVQFASLSPRGLPVVPEHQQQPCAGVKSIVRCSKVGSGAGRSLVLGSGGQQVLKIWPYHALNEEKLDIYP